MIKLLKLVETQPDMRITIGGESLKLEGVMEEKGKK